RCRRSVAWNQTSLAVWMISIGTRNPGSTHSLPPEIRLTPRCPPAPAKPLFDGLQFLAGLEPYRFARRNVDLCAGARIAANSGLPPPYGEDADAAPLAA